ncbi:LacI family DNA-binding transcriptional regulator [Profundibacterium mesophilum]|uniref:Transcriptional regulator repressor n=1 Tax=Profundibacterium mesophilum KAUST100406-0324 TaxID=1037889 RepID=A0A921NZG8_9RHOB|nr:substrate-binding domain-containing protein [Profundibacterium mesophilum]KAF0677499.1 Transcriptional regulator repressor [Profundibacterium mesophilum KAUST100406-0324]
MNLRELSKLLGLSQTTVSRALNNYPEVSEVTRKRVKDAARRHAYAPNRWAKGLATGRPNAIAHVVPVDSTHEMVNPVFADFISGAIEVYTSHGYEMILSLIRAGDGPRIYRDLAARHSVGGLIVHAPMRDDTRLAMLDEIGTPYVVHGRISGARRPYNWIDMDNRRAYRRAAEELIGLGHERIALINGRAGMDFAVRREEGMREALAAAGLPVDRALIAGDEMTEQFGYEAAMRMLEARRPPTAFIISSLVSAIGTRRACEALGLKPGRDISIISHDDDLSYFRHDGAQPYFTSVRSPIREHGTQAALMLLRAIETPQEAPLQTLIEAELIPGRSTAPPPKSSPPEPPAPNLAS